MARQHRRSMKKLKVHGSAGTSVILVGERITKLSTYLPHGKAIVITDESLHRLYHKELAGYPVIAISSGEKNKTLQTVEYIYKKLVEFEADRSTFIVGVGGGIVCDITGFAASTYMRGLRFAFVPTTLLAQVDASIGGKNGVNFKRFKNMIGVFNQPEFVICDMNTLKTLPKREILCGFAEIVKHALIADANMFNFLEKNLRKAIALDGRVIEQLVSMSVAIKSDVVNRDEREQGLRRILNFGHTIGHAIEKCSDTYSHGEAISIGMLAISDLSVRKGWLKPEEYARIEMLIRSIGLPVRVHIPARSIEGAMRKDKKREGKSLRVVFLKGIGNTTVEKVDAAELTGFLRGNDVFYKQ
jgi:3-dehydroquinate synthase